ncbi:MAG: hypothetical protein WAN74_06930 [Thermoplasmata archaeon]
MISTVWLAIAAVAVVVAGAIIYWIGQRRGLGAPPPRRPKGPTEPPRSPP